MKIIPPSSVYKNVDARTSVTFNPEVTTQTRQSRNWKLYIVATNQQGLEIIDPAQMITAGGVMIGDVCMTGLNTYEYSALLNVIEQPIDTDSWSILVRDADTNSNTVPCIANLSGVYCFEVDNSDVLLGKNHFRPAIEIN
jgi:hypothetical protein